MKKLSVILGALTLLGAAACNKSQPESTAGASAPTQPAAEAPADPHAAFTELSVQEVVGLVGAGNGVPVDANGAETRAKYGMLPGAIQLSSYREFAMSELPADKATKLVFYCGGPSCSAAPKAAKLALDAGFTDVNVMPVGITGWVDAGQSVEKPAG